MSFWDHMQLWEKMCLVLAAGMVFTLMAGCCKLIYDKLRIRKHSKIAEARKSHLESVHDSRNVIQLKSDEIPFGIKALEAGVEVEGIVISRPNTPGRYTQSQVTLVPTDAESTKSRGRGPPSPRFAHDGSSGNSSPAPSMKGGRPMIYQPSPYMQLPPASHLGGASVRSSASSLAATTPPITRSSSIERVTQIQRSFSETAVGQEWQQPGKSLATIPDAETLAKLEGRHSQPGYDYRKSEQQSSSRTPSPPESQVSPSLPSVDENEVSEESSRESDSSLDRPRHPRYIRPGLLATYSSPSLPSMSQMRRPLSESAQGDLSLLHTHRLSHAAEVGQLLPRRRQSTNLPASEPISAPGTPQPLYSPSTSNPVYALDIAIPKAQLEGLQYPAPLHMADSLPKRAESTLDGVWLASPGDGAREGRSSGHGGIGSEETSSSKDQVSRSGSDSGSPERKATKTKGKKLQKRSKVLKNKASGDADLEAQK